MTWDLGPEEFEAVLRLLAPERYAYFVKRCGDWEEVWGLRDDRGWVTAEDDGGQVFMPIWPHAEYARACALDGWENAEPASIELDEWVEKWLPELETKRQSVSVFPVPAGNGVAAEPGRLSGDLQAEVELYE